MRQFYSIIWIGVIFISLSAGPNLLAQNPVDTMDNRSDTITQPLDPTDQAIAPEADSSFLTVTSSPDSAFITVDDQASAGMTPMEMILDTGVYRLEAAKEGFEPLTYKLNLLTGQRISARFILKSFPPPPIPAESLGLMYLPEKILEDINAADRVSSSYNRAAETFAIIPLGQGILARFIVDEDDRKEANIMIISGAILSAGSLILGKVLSKRKTHNIEQANAQITEENILINEHNRDVDQQLKEKNEQALRAWQQENSDRGRVIIEQ